MANSRKKIIAKQEYCNKIMQSARELFDYVPELILFNYSRVYGDGSRILFSTEPDFINNFNCGHYEEEKFNLYKLINPLNSDLIIVSEWIKALDTQVMEFYINLITKEKERFNYSDEACLINFEETYIEVFHYYCDNTVIDSVNFFIHLRKLFKQFAIKFIHDHKLLIDFEDKNIQSKINHNKTLNKKDKSRDQFPILLPKKFYLDNSNTYLTNAELKCAIEAINGKSNQEIGDSLGISVRTVEVYMDSMRKKIGCERRNGVIQYLLKNTQNAYLIL